MRLLRRLIALAFAMLLLAGLPQYSAMAAGYATLRMGDSGSAVKRMQTALITHQYLSDVADGKFGPKTHEAVRSFQKGNNLKVDGLAGNQTLTVLYGLGEKSNNTMPGTKDTLVFGSSGSAVLSMQKALTNIGFSTRGIDGKFGNNTLSAVRAFQSANGLSVDGKAGTVTLAKLYALEENAGKDGSAPAPTEPSVILSRTLRSNYTGSDVSLLQTKLAALDYKLDINGTYDSTTISAVREFQRLNRLTVDGIAGANTFKALQSGSAIKAVSTSDLVNIPTTFITLRSGATGEAVKALQKQLALLDYKVDITDKYDSQTIQTVRVFQSINKIAVDGIAGIQTQTLAYSGNAIKCSAQPSAYSAPSLGQIKIMHWFNEVKPALQGKSSIYIYDPVSRFGYTLRLYSLGRHADAEPMTAEDTANMMAAFGGKVTWTPKFVYVRLPSGNWTVATTHNVAHDSQSITSNDFRGHTCVHFLRDMDEVNEHDPGYGVTNQEVLRKGWQNLTGKIIE